LLVLKSRWQNIWGLRIDARENGTRFIPQVWLDEICDQPRSTSALAQVGNRLANQKATGVIQGPVTYFWPLLVIRNMCFLVTVLVHGFLRLLPPFA